MEKMSKKLTEIKWKLVGIFGKLIIDFIFKTSKIEIVGFEKVRPLLKRKKFIGAIWHSRILFFSYYCGTWWNAYILVSQSDDGEIIARILERQGFRTIRGSTTRGGRKALSTMIKKINQGNIGAIIPDGPQGPRFKIQKGIMILGKNTRAPILPMTYSAKRVIIFNSWDRFVLPLPFNRCRVVLSDPVIVPADADKDEVERLRLKLENTLMDITKKADMAFGRDIPE